jgi:hypothetical protein
MVRVYKPACYRVDNIVASQYQKIKAFTVYIDIIGRRLEGAKWTYQLSYRA